MRKSPTIYCQFRAYQLNIRHQVPGDKCWPSEKTWDAFSDVIDGRLVKTEPVAQSCYGKDKDLEQCAVVNKMWSDQDFQTTKPIGRAYPYNITCAPVDYDSGAEPTSCILGSLPIYAVNVTKKEHIHESLKFAREHNIRLAISGTGHDLLGRGDGFGSLEIWLRHYRNSIDFQEEFESVSNCRKSGWKGSAIKIDGVWQWRDVYKTAKANGVIAVGGGSTGPGAIGGCKSRCESQFHHRITNSMYRGFWWWPRTSDSKLRSRRRPDPRGRSHAR